MSWVTFLWSLNAAIALVLAVVCALAWVADRRDLPKLMFCIAAIATAAATPFELGMMRATTAAEIGEQLRWYHLPIFLTLLGQIFFVHYYLGTGRLWLLWSFISIRGFILLANFQVEPNFTFSEITSVEHILFLGEPVTVIGESTPGVWQWLAFASLLLLVAFVIDAVIRAWRKGGKELRRRSVTIGLAIIVPMVANLAITQFVAFGTLHAPLFATIWFLGSLAVIGYELGREVILNSRARLQLAELRREWAQVERVNSLGQLAAALAHELAQPLAATQLNVEAARRHLLSPSPDLDELRAIMDDVQKDSLRAGEIIDRMRAFIKGRTVTPQAFDLDVVAQDVCSLLGPEATSRRIELACNLPADLPLVSGDRVQIGQVIFNLLLNGVDAVQERPANARRVILEARSAKPETLEITVRDTGPGIPEGRFEEVFKPLFTTKGGGMGLGLALSRMIVDAHGGRLWAENGPMGGAIFRFTLPVDPTRRAPSR